MKSLLFSLLLLNGFSCTTATTMVYICDSPNARRYHYKEDCRGLSNCNHRILKVTLEEAKEKNLTLCHWEK